MLDPASTAVILLVDDNPNNLRLLAKILEAEGFTVRKALSGKMALQGANRNPPDLILLDINMPEMNGYEVCQRLKANTLTRDIPVIFISALNQIDDKVQAFALGAQDYITKPFQELEVLARIRNQLMIVQQQRQLLRQNDQLLQEIQERQAIEAEVRQLNADLEQRVQARTLELQQSLYFEAILKRISDRVRDSLDQHQILQEAIEELTVALKLHFCNAILYGTDRDGDCGVECDGRCRTAIFQYQSCEEQGTPFKNSQTQAQLICDLPEIQGQLQQHQVYAAFCAVQPDPAHPAFAILVCPVFDDRVEKCGRSGDLWLFKAPGSSFNQLEIQLVQQVANQCAIALRQARLYEAAQIQVQELQRLNQLKDDFLSTISHELRTPIATMKTIVQMLDSLMAQMPLLEADSLSSENQIPNPRIAQYLEILKNECDRELNLVEDLLNLQRVEAGMFSAHQSQIDLQSWILHVIEPFESRMQEQQQTLCVNLAPNLPVIYLDPLGFSRIIIELLNNALKYTPAGETITVSVDVIADDALNQMSNPSVDRLKNALGKGKGDVRSDAKGGQYSQNALLKLQVINTGAEISAEEIPRIFDKFYRIPSNDPWKYGGTGLGLALVKKLVEQMPGEISVASGCGRTCFTVRAAIFTESALF